MIKKPTYKMLVTWLIIIVVIICLSTSLSCFYLPEEKQETQLITLAPPAETPTETNDSAATSHLIASPPSNQNWISPGKVSIGNFYPGAQADWPLTIHNGNNKSTIFKVAYRIPDYTDKNYSPPPKNAQDWVIIADNSPVLAPNKTQDVTVTLKIPFGVKNIPAKWEFWVSVSDTSQIGQVRTELCSRWFVNMR